MGRGGLSSIPNMRLPGAVCRGPGMVCVGECDFEHIECGFRFKDDGTREEVEQHYKYGFIDEAGKLVINPMFESVAKLPRRTGCSVRWARLLRGFW